MSSIILPKSSGLIITGTTELILPKQQGLIITDQKLINIEMEVIQTQHKKLILT
jgi:hypothetical protein